MKADKSQSVAAGAPRCRAVVAIAADPTFTAFLAKIFQIRLKKPVSYCFCNKGMASA